MLPPRHRYGVDQATVAVCRKGRPSGREGGGRETGGELAVDRVHLEPLIAPALVVDGERTELDVEGFGLRPTPLLEAAHARFAGDGCAGRYLLHEADGKQVMIVA